MPERICLFGGTFDPIHNAHLDIAKEAADKYLLNRVLFVPAGNPPHKDPSGVTPYEHRLRMVQLACSGNPLFVVSDLERGMNPSYSIDTVTQLRRTLTPEDDLFFLIGSDAFDQIETWKRWQDLIRATKFIVVARPGHEYRVPPEASVCRLDDLAMPVSSSEIRMGLAAGAPTPELPRLVREYIYQHGLYGSKTMPT